MSSRATTDSLHVNWRAWGRRAFARSVPRDLALIALVALAGCGTGPSATSVVPTVAPSATKTAPPPRRPPELWGYVPYYDLAAAWSSAAANYQTLTGVSLVRYYLDENGELLTYPGAELIPDWAREQRLTVVPVIANSQLDGWNRDIVARLISDPVRRRHHIERIVAMVSDGAYPGVEIDYESLLATDREDFSTFIEELAASLHAQGQTLSVAVHAKVAEPGAWHGPQAQDWVRLGIAADRIVVLAYDYDPAHPGPISPPQWTQQVLQYAVSAIAPQKVIQGVPLYGYDWAGARPGIEGTYTGLQERARQYGVQPHVDPTSHHLTFAYRTDAIDHQVWFVNAATLAELTTIGRDLQVGGYALWRLGGEDAASWPILVQVRR